MSKSKRLSLCAVIAAVHLLCRCAGAAATPEQIRERVGVYIWGRVADLSAAAEDARSLGADHAVRIFIGPWSDTPPYHDDTRPLAEKLSDPGFRKVLREYEVIMFTAYDSYSYQREYGEADTASEMQARAEAVSSPQRPNGAKIEHPSLGVVQHLARMGPREANEYLRNVAAEYSQFAFTLAQFNRTFIVSNWEAENDVPDVAYWPWFQRLLQARLNGILQGRTRAARRKLPGRIHTAFEFTILPGFQGRESGLLQMGGNLRGVDYLSYSAWWSIGADFDAATMRGSFHEALRRIRARALPGQQLILGEFGEYWDEHPAGERLRAIVDAAIEENVSYLFNWTLYDQPGEIDDHGRDASHFGKFTQERELTPQGQAVKEWFIRAGPAR